MFAVSESLSVLAYSTLRGSEIFKQGAWWLGKPWISSSTTANCAKQIWFSIALPSSICWSFLSNLLYSSRPKANPKAGSWHNSYWYCKTTPSHKSHSHRKILKLVILIMWNQWIHGCCYSKGCVILADTSLDYVKRCTRVEFFINITVCTVSLLSMAGAEYGAVTALGINMDCTRLLSGHARGQVCLTKFHDCRVVHTCTYL